MTAAIVELYSEAYRAALTSMGIYRAPRAVAEHILHFNLVPGAYAV